MKRGFLKTEKAKAKLSADTDTTHHDRSIHKGKGKAKAETSAGANEPCPLLLDLHSIPPSITVTMNYPKDKNRLIFRHWPRDPNGKPIRPSDIHGKEAGNGLNLWGATLYDFYFVRRVPSIAHFMTISTGSKLTRVMKAFGELEHARDEIAWATHEAYPEEIPAWDPAQAIVAHERRVNAGFGVVDKTNERVPVPEVSTAEHEADVQITAPARQAIETRKGAVEGGKDPTSEDTANEPSGKSADSTDEVGMQQPPSEIPVESPFHPSRYPSPWPLVPFESTYSPFALQRGISIHLLPKKLYVHDPWQLVSTSSDHPDTSHEGESWTSKTDHIRTYSLSLPPESQRMVEATSKAVAAAEDEALKIPESVFISPPQETEGPTEQPGIRAFLPKRPRKLTEVPEAHLYLSPKGRLGTGNHSVVYEAELELPRDIFCESTYCKQCLDEQIKVEVDRLKESGEWEERLNKAAKQYETTESRDSPSSSSVQIPPRYVGFVKVILEHVPGQTIDMVASGSTTSEEAPAADAPSQYFARVSDPEIKRYIHYEGLVVPIHPNVQWQNPSLPDTICEHEVGKMKPVPRTAKFRVAAKLSLPDDPHLEREAGNYLKFPAHFFQHWTGYNVVAPLHDPTPVGALVPQFFGYYTPDIPSDSDDGENEYYSPILLIEHCGEPICAKKLSIDDRHECAALLFRFQCAGWLHGSFAERNMLMQKHHPTCSPLEEHQCDLPCRHRRYSFRLIDFGRSVEYETGLRMSRNTEETMGKDLFHIL